MNILVIGPSWIGDMVMSQSLYIVLKKQYPDAKLHVLAPSWCLPLLERMPQVDKAILMPLGHGAFQLLTRWKLGRELAKNNYDWAIIQPNSWKSALIPLFAGIKQRTGWKGESRYGLLNDLRTNKKDFPMMVQRYVALAFDKQKMRDFTALPDFSWPQLRIDSAQQTSALNRLALDNSAPVLALCPGAEFGPAKRWPESHYAYVAQKWLEQTNGQIWIFGSGKDTEVAENIRQQLPESLQEQCRILAGKTSLTEAIDLLATSEIVVSNDSGLMHIAAATGTQLVAVYGSTSTEYTPPLSPHAKQLYTEIECRPCFKRVCPLGHMNCLQKLQPERVFLEIQQQCANRIA